MIEVKGLSHAYRPGAPVLRDVSLSIATGDYVGIVGPNGSGKSTLVRHFNALLTPQQGTVRVDGLDASSRTDRPALRQKVGLVFQNPENQIVGTIVEDDVAFGPENLGIAQPEIRRRVDEALERVRLSELKERSPNTLSGGQKQRLAIASVLAMLPSHLVLDEPLTMLDPQGREEVLEVLARLNTEAGITVVFVTHAIAELFHARRIVAMQAGQVAFDGSLEDFLKDAKLLARLEMELPPLVQLGAELVKRKVLAAPVPLDMKALVDALCS